MGSVDKRHSRTKDPVTVREAWERLLDLNERRWSSQQFHLVMTDSDLVRCMLDTFPDHYAKCETQPDPGRARRSYRPAAWKYVIQEGMLYRATARGRPVGPGVLLPEMTGGTSHDEEA